MNIDALLADTDIEEALSQAYAVAVASHAGYVTSQKNFDRDGIDISIEAGDNFRPKIDVQLKASINLDDSGDLITYFCPKRNYDLLRLDTQTPRILVVMRLPSQKGDWLEVSKEKMTLKHCCYWISLKGYPVSDNKTGQTIYIPAKNRFDVEGLQILMELSRTGKIQ